MRTSIALLLIFVAGCDALPWVKSDKPRSSKADDEADEESSKKKDPLPAPETISAKDACVALSKVALGQPCEEQQPTGLGAAAWQSFKFWVGPAPDGICQVMSFKKNADLEATVKTFDAMAVLAGPHRYANAEKLIFVQCNAKIDRKASGEIERELKFL